MNPETENPLGSANFQTGKERLSAACVKDIVTSNAHSASTDARHNGGDHQAHRVTLFPSLQGQEHGEALPIGEAYRQARAASQAPLAAISAMMAEGLPKDAKEYKEAKKALHPVCYSALFSGSRKTENVTEHSGLVAFDIENSQPLADGETIEAGAHIDLMNALAGEFQPALAHISPRLGVRLILQCSGLAGEVNPINGTAKAHAHKAFYSSLCSRISAWLEGSGFGSRFTLDTGTSAISQPMYPGFGYIEPAEAKDYALPAAPEERKHTAPPRPAATLPRHASAKGSRYSCYQDVPDCVKFEAALSLFPNSDTWEDYDFVISCAGQDSSLFPLVHAWAARSSKYDEADANRKLGTYSGRVTVASLIERAGGVQAVISELIKRGLLEDSTPDFKYNLDEIGAQEKGAGDGEDEDEGIEPTPVPAGLWERLRDHLPLSVRACEEVTDGDIERISALRVLMAVACALAPQARFARAGKRGGGKVVTAHPLSLYLHIIADSSAGKGALGSIVRESGEKGANLAAQATFARYWLDNDLNKGGAMNDKYLLAMEAGETQRLKSGSKEEGEGKPKAKPKIINSHMAARILRNPHGLQLSYASSITEPALAEDVMIRNGAAFLFFSEANKLVSTAKGQHSLGLFEMIKQGVSGDPVVHRTKGEGKIGAKQGKLSVAITSTPNQLKPLYGSGGRDEDGFLNRVAFLVWPKRETEYERDFIEETEDTGADLRRLFEAVALLNMEAGKGRMNFKENAKETKPVYIERLGNPIQGRKLLSGHANRIMERAYALAAMIRLLKTAELYLGASGWLGKARAKRDAYIAEALELNEKEGATFVLPSADVSFSVTMEDVSLAIELARMEADAKEAVVEYMLTDSGRSNLKAIAKASKGEKRKTKEAAVVLCLKDIRAGLNGEPWPSERELVAKLQARNLGIRREKLRKLIEEVRSS